MTIDNKVSVISMVISTANVLYSIYISQKVNKLNMRNNYFNIFKEDLTETIPEYYYKFISEESNGTNDQVGKEFEIYIPNFRKKIRFLSFIDNKNYKIIDDALVKLEEEVILLPKIKNNKEEHLKKFNKLIKLIYKKINNHFS